MSKFIILNMLSLTTSGYVISLEILCDLGYSNNSILLLEILSHVVANEVVGISSKLELGLELKPYAASIHVQLRYNSIQGI